MCENCEDAIKRCAEEVAELLSLGCSDIESGRLLIDLSDDEAPSDLAHDRGLFCGVC